MRDFRRNQAFTLLEVLVALVILSLSYAAALQIFGGAARTADLSGDYRAAMMVAESRLGESTALSLRSRESRSGIDRERFHWKTAVAATSDYEIAGYANRFSTVVVSVDVSWVDAGARHHAISLQTLRLVQGRMP